jgi:pimeloyl-ACP methyl ester carboxylesterase
MSREGKKFAGSGVTLNVLDEGEGLPVLMLHGFPDSCHLWRNQIPPLKVRATASSRRISAASACPTGRRTRSCIGHDLLMADVIALLDAAGSTRPR